MLEMHIDLKRRKESDTQRPLRHDNVQPYTATNAQTELEERH